jgi:hypothetical protein
MSDLPYSESLSDSQIVSQIPLSLRDSLDSLFVREGIDEKLELLKTYESQLWESDFVKVRSYWQERANGSGYRKI